MGGSFCHPDLVGVYDSNKCGDRDTNVLIMVRFGILRIKGAEICAYGIGFFLQAKMTRGNGVNVEVLELRTVWCKSLIRCHKLGGGASAC